MLKTKDFVWEGELLVKIVANYKEKEGYEVNEALDGDETERLAGILLIEFDLMEGNITQEEYLERLERLEIKWKR